MHRSYRILRRWLGRILGALAGGLVLGAPGAAAGFLAGAVVDLWVRLTQVIGLVWSGCGLSAGQRLFLGATALTMGRLAKCDGRVSQREIAAAEQVLRELPLDARARRRAITIFHRGKQPDAPLRPVLALLRLVGRRRPEELARFLEFQLRVAQADGEPHRAQWRLLHWIWRRVGISRADFESRLRAGRPGGGAQGVQLTLDHAYRLLGVSRNASGEEVRKAYRRAISRSHPDRLIARGGSRSELEAASERTRRIRAAYDAIRRARGEIGGQAGGSRVSSAQARD